MTVLCSEATTVILSLIHLSAIIGLKTLRALREDLVGEAKNLLGFLDNLSDEFEVWMLVLWVSIDVLKEVHELTDSESVTLAGILILGHFSSGRISSNIGHDALKCPLRDHRVVPAKDLGILENQSPRGLLVLFCQLIKLSVEVVVPAGIFLEGGKVFTGSNHHEVFDVALAFEHVAASEKRVGNLSCGLAIEVGDHRLLGEDKRLILDRLLFSWLLLGWLLGLSFRVHLDGRGCHGKCCNKESSHCYSKFSLY